MILAGGQGERLSILSAHRAKPAVPYGGKYRIIDFALSNCVNSGLFDILVLTQYRPISLHDHIGTGKPWDLDRQYAVGVRMISPYLGRRGADWYRGTADAVYQNIQELRELRAEHTMVLGGDHIYMMDYRPMIEKHVRSKADVTIGLQNVPVGGHAPLRHRHRGSLRPHHAVAGEAEEGGRHARLDGLLRLPHRVPDRAPARGRRDAGLEARLRRRRGAADDRRRRCASTATASTATGATSGRSSRTTTPTWSCSPSRRRSTSTTAAGRSTRRRRGGRPASSAPAPTWCSR